MGFVKPGLRLRAINDEEADLFIVKAYVAGERGDAVVLFNVRTKEIVWRKASTVANWHVVDDPEEK